MPFFQSDALSSKSVYVCCSNVHTNIDYILTLTHFTSHPPPPSLRSPTTSNSNDVDVIVWSMFAQGYNQCSDEPMGTYITPVPTFVGAYMDQLESNNQDYGNDDYVTPDAAAYIDCTQVVIQNQEYYVQLGCTDGTSQSISVNIYTDNTCETRSTVDGYDDSNIDASEVQVGIVVIVFCVDFCLYSTRRNTNHSHTHSFIHSFTTIYQHSYRLSNARCV